MKGKYKYIFFAKAQRKWRVAVWYMGRPIYGGYYVNIQDAVIARDKILENIKFNNVTLRRHLRSNYINETKKAMDKFNHYKQDILVLTKSETDLMDEISRQLRSLYNLLTF